MQKARKGGSPPRSKKSSGAAQRIQAARADNLSAIGTPDWLLEQQEGLGNQAVMGMIGSSQESERIADGRAIGRMVDWSANRDGSTKVTACFPPGTEVVPGNFGTIADKYGFVVERWEIINDIVHVELTTMAPEEFFAWGNDVILGHPPPETILDEVQEDESHG